MILIVSRRLLSRAGQQSQNTSAMVQQLGVMNVFQEAQLSHRHFAEPKKAASHLLPCLLTFDQVCGMADLSVKLQHHLATKAAPSLKDSRLICTVEAGRVEAFNRNLWQVSMALPAGCTSPAQEQAMLAVLESVRDIAEGTPALAAFCNKSTVRRYLAARGGDCDAAAATLRWAKGVQCLPQTCPGLLLALVCLFRA